MLRICGKRETRSKKCLWRIKMKKTGCLILSALLLLLTACAGPAAEQSTPVPTVAAATPAPTAAQDPIGAATAHELREMIAQYKSEGDYGMVYAAALRLTEIEPSDASAYIEATEALLALSEANVAEINRLLALGGANAPDAQLLYEWAEQNQPDFAIAVAAVPDSILPGEANTDGVTAGNLSNVGKYGGAWRGGLLTWQGSRVYLSRPDEDFAIYKMRADGSGYQRLGAENGFSLNAVGEWIYYININDGDKPYKMLTDGSMNTRLSDDSCAFLSVSGGYMYYDNGSDDGCLYRVNIETGEQLKLTDGTVMFPCVSDGWIYYSPKSADSGLWRVPADGGEPRQLARGFIQTYCIADGWVYYVNVEDPYGIHRVRTDGTGYEMLFPFDFPITTFNISGGTMYICFNLAYQEDGFFISEEIVAIDIATLGKGVHVDAKTEPLCTGPEGWVYFAQYEEGLAWYAMNQAGEVMKIG